MLDVTNREIFLLGVSVMKLQANLRNEHIATGVLPDQQNRLTFACRRISARISYRNHPTTASCRNIYDIDPLPVPSRLSIGYNPHLHPFKRGWRVSIPLPTR